MRQLYSNKKKGLKDPRRSFRNRLIFLSLGLLAWSSLIFFKLVKLQILESERIKTVEAKRLMKKRNIPALRGEIRDTHGKPLAISYYKARIILDPVEIRKPFETAAKLAEYLGKDKAWVQEIAQSITKKQNANSRYFPLFSNIGYEIGRTIYDCGKGRDREPYLSGVHVEFFPERHYPKRWLASHLVGFVNKYDSTYNEGLERAYDSFLAGQDGVREVLSDAKQNDLAIGGRTIKKPLPGAHLELTIDENIQFLVENELQYAMKLNRADAITCIVIEPESGDVLAMANFPDFNPENYGSPQRDRLISRRNRAIEFQYEPASAFKIITIATALEKGLISLDEKVYCENGSIEVFNRIIRDHKRFGNLTFREVLWYSSNVGAIKAALKLKPEEFYEAIEKFGFGRKTGIDLPAEINGKLRPVTEWQKTSSSFLAIGHEIGTTPLQMLVAANVIANGGYLVEPRVGKKLILGNGTEKELGADRKPRQILKPSTAALMKDALIGVVEHGTAKKAALPGIKVFGKTGTAQRITQTGYSNKDYNASFVGFFPAEKPRYGMIIVVYNPQQGGVHGGEVAAPIFGRIGEGILWYERSRVKTETSEILQVEPVAALKESEPDGSLPFMVTTEPQVIKGQMPDVMGLGLKTALKKCASAGIFPQVKGSGWVESQFPGPSQPIESAKNSWIQLSGG